MKTMSCKQLGGACDKEFTANSFDKIAEMSKQHGMEMLQHSEAAHIEAMNKMKALMSEPEKMQQWFENKRQEFESLAEDEPK